MRMPRFAIKLLAFLSFATVHAYAVGQAHARTFQTGENVQFYTCDPGQLPTRWRSGVVSDAPRQTSGLVQVPGSY